jgi:hypothetical protein
MQLISIISRVEENYMIRSGGMKCAGHVPCMSEIRNTCMHLIGKYAGKRPLEHLCADRRQH